MLLSVMAVVVDIGTIGNMVAKSVELDAVTCVERKTNKTSLLYECARESAEIDARATVGKTVRFEHSDAFSVAVCEVVVYTNPSRQLLSIIHLYLVGNQCFKSSD